MASSGRPLPIIVTIVITYSSFDLKGTFSFVTLTIVIPDPKIVYQLGTQQKSGGTLKEFN